jgi:cell division protein ZapA (FtsZ GTPase activity inhibitor)
MGQVAVTIMGRTYTLRCTDGEEARLVELAGYIKERADALAAEFRSGAGPVSDDRLLLLVAISLADELWEAREVVPSPAAPALNAGHVPPSDTARPRANGRVAR